MVKNYSSKLKYIKKKSIKFCFLVLYNLEAISSKNETTTKKSLNEKDYNRFL